MTGIEWIALAAVLAYVASQTFDRATGRDTSIVCCEHCEQTAQLLEQVLAQIKVRMPVRHRYPCLGDDPWCTCAPAEAATAGEN